jgi:GNAT superfamily N-acetyltransferase
VLSPTSLGEIDTYWAEFFGCDPAALSMPDVLLVPHAALNGYPGIMCFRHGPACIVSVPETLLEAVSARLLPSTPEGLFDVEVLSTVLGKAVRAVIGPAWIGYRGESEPRPEIAAGARPLTEADAPALESLIAANSRRDVEHSAIERTAGTFGVFAGGVLVAAAAGEPRGERILDIGVLTRRDSRGRGHGGAVVAALANAALAAGRIPQFRTLIENEPALRIARSLGFIEYAKTIAVRLDRAGDEAE